MQKTIYILLIILSIASTSWCIYRDMQIEKQYTGDLRNRIAGARLQKDEKPPYFYKWKNADGLRYYDPQNFDTLKVSNITATPLLHQLLYPLADFPQRKISKTWLIIEYLFLLGMVAIGFSFAKNIKQRLAVIFTAVIFLYTGAWTNHIAAGQVYLLIPFLSLLFYFFINRNKKNVFAVAAGISAAILLLIRPTAVFFLLPFLFLSKKYNLKYKLIFSVSFVLILTFSFVGSQNQLYWKDYSAAMKEQVKSHQSLGAAVQKNEPDPGYTQWEGWDMKEVAKAYAAFPYTYNQEHGNVFVIIKHTIHSKVPVWLLTCAAIISMGLFTFLFYKKNTPAKDYTLFTVSMLAFELYMISDFFSPVHRFLYNGVQWLFPLSLIAAGYQKKYTWIYAGFIGGLILNSISISFMPMENTLGEYLIFLFLLVFVFYYKKENAA